MMYLRKIARFPGKQVVRKVCRKIGRSLSRGHTERLSILNCERPGNEVEAISPHTKGTKEHTGIRRGVADLNMAFPLRTSVTFV